MTGPAWFAVVVSIAALAVPPAQARACPSSWASTVPSHIWLVGTNGVEVDPLGQFTVTVRDIASNLLPNSFVTVDFTSATGLSIASTQPFPGTSTFCSAHVVGSLTNVNGVATFRIFGCAHMGTGAPRPTVRVLADGCLLREIPVAALDLDGDFGVGSNDLSCCLGDILTGQPHGRSDFDGDGTLSANDLSMWLTGFLAAGSTFSATTLCP